MIEVEKKFQPTEEQLEKMLEGAEFLGEVVNHDIYYEYEDFRMHKSGVCLRKRNNSFELKISVASSSKKEIEDEEEIKKYFHTELPLQEFIDQNLIVFTDFKNNRKKYKKGKFTIDVDNMDFGYNMCEIELMVNDKSEAKNAEEEIVNFTKEYKIDDKKILTKRGEYLKRFKPEIYKEIYGDK